MASGVTAGGELMLPPLPPELPPLPPFRSSTLGAKSVHLDLIDDQACTMCQQHRRPAARCCQQRMWSNCV